MPLINYIANRQECLGATSGLVRGNAPEPPSLSVQYLLVGGGSATYLTGTGGSGGGFVSASATIPWNSVLTVTVGLGGADGSGDTGQSSSLSGSTFGYAFAGGATSAQSGEPQFNPVGLGDNIELTNGGGGGAGEAGESSAANNGNGGDGLLWLNGIYYAGGGGGTGAPERPSLPGDPGLGGGGSANPGYQLNGTNGLGGGAAGTGTLGGSGVVIIRYPTTSPRMGDGGTQYESDGYFYHEFTGSGLFTYEF
jgi:hypothetical protein